MKAIIIKDDRDIKFLDVREKQYELYVARRDPITTFKESEEKISQESISFTKEVYELICVRKNGDLVYRLKR
jgi:hypothetical protein